MSGSGFEHGLFRIRSRSGVEWLSLLYLSKYEHSFLRSVHGTRSFHIIKVLTIFCSVAFGNYVLKRYKVFLFLFSLSFVIRSHVNCQRRRLIIFSDAALFSLVEPGRLFSGTYCLQSLAEYSLTTKILWIRVCNCNTTRGKHY